MIIISLLPNTEENNTLFAILFGITKLLRVLFLSSEKE